MNDPSYIKDLKLQLLSAVADDSNAFEIVTELTEYVTDIDEHLAREAVRAVGRIALQVLFLCCCCPAASACALQASAAFVRTETRLYAPRAHSWPARAWLECKPCPILLSVLLRCKMCRGCWTGCWASWSWVRLASQRRRSSRSRTCCGGTPT